MTCYVIMKLHLQGTIICESLVYLQKLYAKSFVKIHFRKDSYLSILLFILKYFTELNIRMFLGNFQSFLLYFCSYFAGLILSQCLMHSLEIFFWNFSWYFSLQHSTKSALPFPLPNSSRHFLAVTKHFIVSGLNCRPVAFAMNAIATMRKTKLEIVKVFILQLRIAVIT